MAMGLRTRLTRVVFELKTLRTNFTKQNVLIGRYRHHLGLLMGFKKPVTHSFSLIFVKTLQM